MKTRLSRHKDPHRLSQNFPAEIWQKIARHMGPREWAKVSSICRTTWHLQLDPVLIKQDGSKKHLCAKGVAWVLKRARLTQQLGLDLPADSASLHGTLSALMQVLGGFSRLAALSFKAELEAADEDMRALTAALAWLLGQSKGLVFLSIESVDLPCLPTLSHIRHLHLDPGSLQSFSRLAPALGRLVTLQTLCLNARRPILAVDPDAHLDLHALTQLESVMLDGVVPAFLTLPKGAALHAIVYSLLAARHRVWQSALGALKSFTIEAPSERIQMEAAIPPWMLEVQNLETLVLALEKFSSADAMGLSAAILLKGAFVNTERLCLECSECIHVHLPKEHKLRVVQLQSYGTLCVNIADVGGFAASCEVCEFTWSQLEGVDLILLFPHLMQSGKYYSMEKVWHPHCRMLCGGLPMLHESHRTHCRCGACQYCCRLDNFQGRRAPLIEDDYQDLWL